jgi:hypothetical protein
VPVIYKKRFDEGGYLRPGRGQSMCDAWWRDLRSWLRPAEGVLRVPRGKPLNFLRPISHSIQEFRSSGYGVTLHWPEPCHIVLYQDVR